MEEISKALKELGFSGKNGQQVVLTGGGAELVGLADYAQAALGRPVRIGNAPRIAGLAEQHVKPGFASLAGLVLYAAADPVDIRSISTGYQSTMRYGKLGMAGRVYRAMRDYF
jgi:cell division protein FtsA